MQIRITNKLPEKQSLAFLISRDDLLKDLPLNDQEKDFVNIRHQAKDKLIVVNQYSRWVFIQFSDAEKNEFLALEELRKAGYQLHKEIAANKINAICLIDKTNESGKILALAEGITLSNYQFLKYFKDAGDKKYSLQELSIKSVKIKKEEVFFLKNISEGVFLARTLINEPVIYMNATRLADEIKEMGKNAGFQVEVFEKNKIEALKMSGLLAVNKGSLDPPTFSVLEWKPVRPKNKKPIVLVGKGVVFDTGGLSLKPTPDSMDYMKSDMSGAAAVAGILYAVAKSKLPVHLIGLIPATDNRPGGNAYTPGDVITMGNGLTVEVLNTDAEGRMILAEALHYATNYKPELVIDLATLTGAAAIAIGKYGIVGMGNAGQEVFDLLIKSGERVGERIVKFPFWEEFDELLKSDIADLKNIGGRESGAITAGKFLEHFTNYPYIHLDIAGPAFVKKEFEYRGKGGTGYGIRLLFDFFRRFTEK